MFVAFGVQSFERDGLVEVKFAQEVVDSLAFATREDVMYGRAESIIAHGEGVATTARVLMGINDGDASTGLGQQ